MTTTSMSDPEFEKHRAQEMQCLLAALDEAQARNAGMDVAAWRALPEHEQIRLQEDFDDSQFAHENQRTTLEAYRADRRRLIEAGKLRPDCGFPQWLRDQYAAERPVGVIVEYLDLLTTGATAGGEALGVILLEIDRRTGRGFIGTGLPFAEAKSRLLEEIDRAGLTAYFREAEAQQRERANQ